MSKNIGKIAQIIGPVVDVKFDNSAEVYQTSMML